MENAEQINKVLSLIRTKSEAGEVLSCLENLSAALFSSKEQSAREFFSRLPQSLADALSEIFAKEPITQTNRHEIEGLLNQLKDAVRACEVLNLTLAFRPDEETISLFSSWIKDHVAKNIVFELHVDHTIGAGALIIYKGQYKDFTVKKKLSSVFQLQKEEIMGLLGSTKQ